MAKHKAPTQVSIAPRSEKSAFEQAVSKYWLPVAGIGIAIAAGIVIRQVTSEQEKATVSQHWDALRDRVDLTALQNDESFLSPEEMRALADELEDTAAGPWARALAAEAAMRANAFDQAEAAVSRLKGSHPDHALVVTRFEFGDEESSESKTLPDHLGSLASAQADWTSNHPRLFDAPAVPEDAPRVRFVTDRGDVVIGLYTDRAPQHTQNFLELCREGYYDGTLFHRVLKDMIVQGGDPNSRDGDPATWGLGGPDEKIDPEPSDAWHFRGMLAAARGPGDVQSSGSQFYVTVSPQHQYDKQYTVFGRVLEGMEVFDSLSEEAVEGEERPEVPGQLLSTEVLD